MIGASSLFLIGILITLLVARLIMDDIARKERCQHEFTFLYTSIDSKTGLGSDHLECKKCRKYTIITHG